MSNEKTRSLYEELRDSYCEKDWKHKHFWKKLGVIKEPDEVLLVWRCSQCGLCNLEELKFVSVSNLKEGTDSYLQGERKTNMKAGAGVLIIIGVLFMVVTNLSKMFNGLGFIIGVLLAFFGCLMLIKSGQKRK